MIANPSSNYISGCNVHNMDWFHCPHDKKHYLIALTDYELRLYYSLPTDWAEWDNPVKSIPLLGTRSVILHGELHIGEI